MTQQSLNLPYIVLGGVAVLAIIAAVTIIWPLITTLQSKQVELASVQTRLQEQQAFLLTIDRKRAELVQNAEQERSLGIILPVDDAVDDITRIIYRAAQVSSVTVNTLTNATASQASNALAARARGEVNDVPSSVVPVSFSVEVVGTYQQYRFFMEQLERSIRINDVNNIDISRVNTQPDAVNVKMQLRFYKFRTSPDAAQ